MLAPNEAPALQVIVLGSGGGPLESNTTAFLVRSVASGWSKGSIVAVDAGVHLSAISQKGPFAGLELQNKSALANGARITHDLIDTYLITHPHLDHISGFVVNTAALSGTRPKKLAGLPTTISAFKKHIFNNVIWPNLSDENNGVGLVTYMRLVEGGNPALGEGDGKGYVEVNDGLAVKMWSVSHGHCMERHSHRGSTSSQGGFGSGGSVDAGRGSLLHSTTVNGTSHIKNSISNGSGHTNHHNGLVRPSGLINQATALAAQSCECRERICVYDSSAYFIRDVATAREILIFGDVEPDSLSLSPRNHQVWLEAGPKIAQGHLAAIFIECSYDNSQADERLFGHLKPVYIMEELQALAEQVRAARLDTSVLRESRKRKREHNSMLTTVKQRKPPPPSLEDQDPVSPKSMRPVSHVAIATPEGSRTSHISSPVSELSLLDDVEALPGSLSPLPPAIQNHDTQTHIDIKSDFPLRGVKVVIIHMKEKFTDEDDVGVTIKKELDELEAAFKLGCEFIISYSGQSLYL
ncbi:3' 5'-cyclic-nucleotide phosphodiesterase [Ceratocystis lukuohia]|uniref:3' 5'-cyclic-nucleotide phosphodiesterase n=1 Tax=Ceratocystis lukuohia TaxID=2019550 RepID=A0ABR4MDV5_9PEZI